MNIFQQLFGGGPKVDLKATIAEGAFLVDVRTPGEFSSGHVKGSVNIPLDSITHQLAKFKNKNHEKNNNTPFTYTYSCFWLCTKTPCKRYWNSF